MAQIQHSVVTEITVTLDAFEAGVLQAVLGSIGGGISDTSDNGYTAERQVVNALYHGLNLPGVENQFDRIIAKGHGTRLVDETR